MLATATLPTDSGSGYVAAAYIVFLALVLVYVAIMAFRLTRVERRLRELVREAQEREAREQPQDTPHNGEQVRRELV